MPELITERLAHTFID